MESRSNAIDNRAAAQAPVAPHTAGSAYVTQSAVSKRGSSPARWLLAGLAALAMCGFAAATLWFVGVGSVFDNLASVKVGELRVESRSILLSSAGPITVNVNMGQGTLTIAGGASVYGAENAYGSSSDLARPSPAQL